ncbi:MAG: IclR family transcriptional regulator [Dehalococcoidales bacterium]|nr:IclR family transcriptional regulator [Dehalococcoidales bacterium]
MKTVNKVLDLMEAFLSSEGELGVSELAKLTGFNNSTANRIAMTLAKRGYLKQSGKRGKYALGMKFFSYISPLKRRIKFRHLALPFMVKLCQEADDSVDLVSSEGKYCVSIEVVPTTNMLRAVPAEGTSYELYNSSGGKAILAGYTDSQMEEYRKTVIFKPHTSNTITNMTELTKHLKIVRQEGVAFDCEEMTLNVHSVAAAIKGADGHFLGAIAVVGPKSRLTRTRMEELAPVIKEYALNISREMGYRGMS